MKNEMNLTEIAVEFNRLAAEEFGHTKIHWGLIQPADLEFARANCSTETEVIDELLSLFAVPFNY